MSIRTLIRLDDDQMYAVYADGDVYRLDTYIRPDGSTCTLPVRVFGRQAAEAQRLVWDREAA